MAAALQVFVSSSCNELRDMRAGIRDWLTNLGLDPVMSEESGFQHQDGMPPYAACLQALEECPLVVGVIDRRYGKTFDDWGPYPEYKGLAPTHAELRHALRKGKTVLIYVHEDIWSFYEVWRKNRDAFKSTAPAGLEEDTLRLFEELKLRDPAPWIERFRNVSEVTASLNKQFVNHLYRHLRDKEAEATNTASYFAGKLETVAPEVREKIASGLSPTLIADRDSLQKRLNEIEAQLLATQGTTQERIAVLERERNDVQGRFETVSKQLQNSSLMLARAAVRDVPWLDFIRRTMMPKQPGRVPFHHSGEVALRGYTLGTGRFVVPVLHEVTWSKLPEIEGGLHRGGNAAIIFRGANFVPGITFAYRRRGEPQLSPEHTWMEPNIYFGDYLEVNSTDDEHESPLSWRDYEFQVRNPEGRKSEWVLFTYAFDDAALNMIRIDALKTGSALLAAGKPTEAVEPLRKGYTFTDRMHGINHPETQQAKEFWSRALDGAALAKLRFREGDRLYVHSGPEAGKRGVVEKLLLRHHHAYSIKPSAGESFQASDEQVERG